MCMTSHKKPYVSWRRGKPKRRESVGAKWRFEVKLGMDQRGQRSAAAVRECATIESCYLIPFNAFVFSSARAILHLNSCDPSGMMLMWMKTLQGL